MKSLNTIYGNVWQLQDCRLSNAILSPVLSTSSTQTMALMETSRKQSGPTICSRQWSRMHLPRPFRCRKDRRFRLFHRHWINIYCSNIKLQRLLLISFGCRHFQLQVIIEICPRCIRNKSKTFSMTSLHACVQGFSMGPAVLPPNNTLTLHVPGISAILLKILSNFILKF